MTLREHGRRFDGRSAVITGASRGIGLAIAKRIVEEGGRVVITARKPEGLDRGGRGPGARPRVAVAGRGDDPEHQQDAVDTAVGAFGRLDVLVNNTGINPAYGPLAELDEGVARKIMDVNVLSALGWTRRAVAAGLGRGPARRGGQHGLGRRHRARRRASRTTASARRR